MVWLVEATKILRCGMVYTQFTSYERCRLVLAADEMSHLHRLWYTRVRPEFSR